MIFVLLSTVAAGVLFARRVHNVTDDLDKVESALQSAGKYFTSGGHIQFRNISGKNELHGWARYVCAPAYVAYRTHHFDTVLTMCPVQPATMADSTFQQMRNDGEHIFWQQRDNEYYYLLSERKH